MIMQIYLFAPSFKTYCPYQVVIVDAEIRAARVVAINWESVVISCLTYIAMIVHSSLVVRDIKG